MIAYVDAEPADAASPCINTCAIDPATGWCRGCARTLDEIAGWGGSSIATKRAIRARLPERLAQMTPARPVAAAIIVEGGRVLVTRRAAGQAMAGLWEFPGGKVEPGETVEACIVRELAEELALVCEAGPILTSAVYRYPGGAIDLIAVHVRIVAGELRLTVHDKARWLLPAELEGVELAPADLPIARWLQAKSPHAFEP